MDLQNSPYKKKFLSPEDDWNLIYQEALAARKVLYEAKNKAYVKLEQLHTRKSLFFVISIIFLIIGFLLPIHEYFKSENFQDYLYNLNIFWSVVLIPSAIFSFFFPYSNRTIYTLEREINIAEQILDELDYELFSREDDKAKLISDTYGKKITATNEE